MGNKAGAGNFRPRGGEAGFGVISSQILKATAKPKVCGFLGEKLEPQQVFIFRLVRLHLPGKQTSVGP